jgi:hypothetical protein
MLVRTGASVCKDNRFVCIASGFGVWRAKARGGGGKFTPHLHFFSIGARPLH